MKTELDEIKKLFDKAEAEKVKAVAKAGADAAITAAISAALVKCKGADTGYGTGPEAGKADVFSTKVNGAIDELVAALKTPPASLTIDAAYIKAWDTANPTGVLAAIAKATPSVKTELDEIKKLFDKAEAAAKAAADSAKTQAIQKAVTAAIGKCRDAETAYNPGGTAAGNVDTFNGAVTGAIDALVLELGKAPASLTVPAADIKQWNKTTPTGALAGIPAVKGDLDGIKDIFDKAEAAAKAAAEKAAAINAAKAAATSAQAAAASAQAAVALTKKELSELEVLLQKVIAENSELQTTLKKQQQELTNAKSGIGTAETKASLAQAEADAAYVDAKLLTDTTDSAKATETKARAAEQKATEAKTEATKIQKTVEDTKEAVIKASDEARAEKNFNAAIINDKEYKESSAAEKLTALKNFKLAIEASKEFGKYEQAKYLELIKKEQTKLYSNKVDPVTWEFKPFLPGDPANVAKKIADLEVRAGITTQADIDAKDCAIFCKSKAANFNKMGDIIEELRDHDTSGEVRKLLTEIVDQLSEMKEMPKFASTIDEQNNKKNPAKQAKKAKIRKDIVKLEEKLEERSITSLNDTLKVLNLLRKNDENDGVTHRHLSYFQNQLNSLVRHNGDLKADYKDKTLVVVDKKTEEKLFEAKHHENKLQITSGNKSPTNGTLVEMVKTAAEAAEKLGHTDFVIKGCGKQPQTAIMLYLLAKNSGLEPTFIPDSPKDHTGIRVADFIKEKSSDPDFRDLINIYNKVKGAATPLSKDLMIKLRDAANTIEYEAPRIAPKPGAGPGGGM